MRVLSKALVYLACVPIGFAIVLIAHAVIVRQGGPCQAPCDAPAMGLLFELIFFGPLMGLVIGYLVATWLEHRERGRCR